VEKYIKEKSLVVTKHCSTPTKKKEV